MLRIVLAVMILLAVAVPTAFANGPERVTICHVPPGNPENAQTLEDMPINALNGHFDNNGVLHNQDYFGPCQSAEATPTIAPSPSESPSPEPSIDPSVEPSPSVVPNTNEGSSGTEIVLPDTAMEG